MKGIASHFALLNENDIARKSVLLFDNNYKLLNIYALSDLSVETSGTLFVDGLVSLPIVSVSMRVDSEQWEQINKNYQIIGLHNAFGYNNADPRPLLVDFASEDNFECYRNIQKFFGNFAAVNLFEFVKAATVRPALLTTLTTKIEIGKPYQLIAWQTVDLLNGRLKQHTRPAKLTLFE